MINCSFMNLRRRNYTSVFPRHSTDSRIEQFHFWTFLWRYWHRPEVTVSQFLILAFSVTSVSLLSEDLFLIGQQLITSSHSDLSQTKNRNLLLTSSGSYLLLSVSMFKSGCPQRSQPQTQLHKDYPNTVTHIIIIITTTTNITVLAEFLEMTGD